MAVWIFAVLALQCLMLAMLGRSAPWRATGLTGLLSLAVIYLLWQATNGAKTGTEAWLVLTSLPLVALGAFTWQKPLGKLALVLGVILTLALLLTWRWATGNQNVDPTTAIIIYASLVLVAMVALFMIAGVLGMRLLIERSEGAPESGDQTSMTPTPRPK